MTLPWAIQVSRTQSCEALDRLMDVWHEAMTAAGSMVRTIGFDASMGERDWESAKGSILRAYGRSDPDQQSTLDTLSAAIQRRNVLGHGPRLDRGPARPAE